MKRAIILALIGALAGGLPPFIAGVIWNSAAISGFACATALGCFSAGIVLGARS